MLYQNLILIFVLLFLLFLINKNSIEKFENNNPIFTVIIPLYNNQDYIVDTINSVLEQTFQDFEIIVVDDKSTDNSYSLVKNTFKNNNKIRIYQNEKNMGTYKTQNFALEKANGQYICLLGSDDKFLKNRLEEDYKHLQNNDAVISKYDRIDEKTGDLIKRRYGESMITFNKTLIDKIGPWINCKFGGDSEYKFRIKLLLGDKSLKYNNKVLYKALTRKGEDNLTSIHKSDKRKIFRKYFLTLHKFYGRKIDKNTNKELLGILDKISLSNDDHKQNLKILTISL